MELKLVDGSYTAGRRFGLASVGGAEAAAQRIVMKLQARRGGFAPLPEYGSRLYLLYSVKPAEREAAARQYIAEALALERELTLKELNISYGEAGSIALDLMFEYQGDKEISIKTLI